MATVDSKVSYHGFGSRGRQTRPGEKSCCSIEQLTAYWTPPPVLPRRIVNESKCLSCSLTRACWIFLGAILLTYFLVMDIILFTRYFKTNLVNEGKVGAPGELYSPFTHLTCKAVLSDHVRHYILTPTAEFFNTVTHFTTIFSFVSANMVSGSHLVVAFLSGKFVASENLQDRRIGVALYWFRTWLDAFDGIVYRAHAGQHLQYNSVYATSGYLVDVILDTLGGFFLSFGILFYLFKTYGPMKSPGVLPVWSKNADSSTDSPGLTNGHSVLSSRETYSYKYLFLKTLSYGVCLSVTGICWDKAVQAFTYVFQTPLEDSSLSVLQTEISHSFLTVCIFFVWRFISGQTVINYMLVAIYMDKVWEFLRYTQWVLLFITVPLFVSTVIYTVHIQSTLHL